MADNTSTTLNRIAMPALNQVDFGAALAEQFANIDLNFQKLSRMDLGRGRDGRSCTYLAFNLDSIFCYSSTGEDDAVSDSLAQWIADEGNVEETTVTSLSQEGAYFHKFQSIISDPAIIGSALADTYARLHEEVEKDYQAYYKLTGGRRQDYVRMCLYLLFGSYQLFDLTADYIQQEDGTWITVPRTDHDVEVSAESLTGALRDSKSSVLRAPVTLEDVTGTIHDYRAIWLYDFFLADNIATDATEFQDNEKLKLYKEHITLFHPGKIIVAVSLSDEDYPVQKYALGKTHPVGSLAYVYADPRFRNEYTGLLSSQVNSATTALEDLSCVLYWEPDLESDSWGGGFKVVNLFPQIYYDGTGFYWNIQGNNTRIPVTGIPGEAGRNSQFVIVERVENIYGAAPNKLQGEGVWAPSNTYIDPTAEESDLEKTTIVQEAFSGKGSQYQKIEGESAAEYLDNYPGVPGTHRKVETMNGKVIKAEESIEPAATWYAGPASADNSEELEHTYRILRVVGQDYFWTNRYAGNATPKPYRPNDPCFDLYNYGMKNAVTIDPTSSVQSLISSLDGCPCIVIPGPSYHPGYTDTTIWFSTLRAVPYTDDPNGAMQLVCFCGIENQMRSRIDEHSQAGAMQDLDVYTFKSPGDNRNKPRGLMLPIGSSKVALAESEDPDIYANAWASHFIHSDAGGLVNRSVHDGGKGAHEGEDDIYIGQSVVTADQTASTLGLDIEAPPTMENPGERGYFLEGQYKEVFGKRVLHIGSVRDYRSLNYVTGTEYDEEPQDTWNPNAAIPGRDYNLSTSVPTGQGLPRFFGKMEDDWFVGSELHIDEPVTITRYRDLQRKGTLLNVEGDVIIGPHTHVNFPDLVHGYAGGGLLIQSTLTREAKDKFQGKTIFPEDFFKGLKLAYPKPFDWIQSGDETCLARGNRYQLGITQEPGDTRLDGLFYQGEEWYKGKQEAGVRSFPSLLAEDMIGARVMVAMDGFAVFNEGDTTSFAVDRDGNIQIAGSEVRSTNTTRWIFSDFGTSDLTIELRASDTRMLEFGFFGNFDPEFGHTIDFNGTDVRMPKATVSGTATIGQTLTANKIINSRHPDDSRILLSNGDCTNEIPVVLKLNNDKASIDFNQSETTGDGKTQFIGTCNAITNSGKEDEMPYWVRGDKSSDTRDIKVYAWADAFHANILIDTDLVSSTGIGDSSDEIGYGLGWEGDSSGAVCDGFKWDTVVGSDFPKPQTDCDFWIGGEMKGCVRLTTDGQLYIHSCVNKFISYYNQRYTISFSYPVRDNTQNSLTLFVGPTNFIKYRTSTGTIGVNYLYIQEGDETSDSFIDMDSHALPIPDHSFDSTSNILLSTKLTTQQDTVPYDDPSKWFGVVHPSYENSNWQIRYSKTGEFVQAAVVFEVNKLGLCSVKEWDLDYVTPLPFNYSDYSHNIIKIDYHSEFGNRNPLQGKRVQIVKVYVFKEGAAASGTYVAKIIYTSNEIGEDDNVLYSGPEKSSDIYSDPGSTVDVFYILTYGDIKVLKQDGSEWTDTAGNNLYWSSVSVVGNFRVTIYGLNL